MQKLFDSLLLSEGNGIFPESKKVNNNNRGIVAIGIGGTGIAALRSLKKKIHERILPDHPGEDWGRYDNIQLLAIDSDDTVERGSGVGRLTNAEYFSISKPGLKDVFTAAGKNIVKQKNSLNWMDIDTIGSAIVYPNGTCGVRQIGRYLLFEKAPALKAAIEQKCVNSLRAANGYNLEIYIFAGLSGGTGSGCFIDTCYIVNKVLEERGHAGSSIVKGFFFLPDVEISKRGFNNNIKHGLISNSYAALKELNYLMDLRNANDYFEQYYGTFTIRTNNPPVDLCYLISAKDQDGNIRVSGFDYCINSVSDYVMSEIIEGPIMPLPLAQTVPNGFYHSIGTASAEISPTYIATFLATRFYQKFDAEIGRKKANALISKNTVDDWVKRLQLDADSVYRKVCHGEKSLILPDCDPKILAQYGVPAPGRIVDFWYLPGKDFLDMNSGKRMYNCQILNESLGCYDKELIQASNTQSLIQTVFLDLMNLCVNPAYGPYYAASLLHNSGYDLRYAVKEAKEIIKCKKATLHFQLYGKTGNDGFETVMTQAATDFCYKPKKLSFDFSKNKRYETYKSTVERYYMFCNTFNQLNDTERLLNQFEYEIDLLWTNFFEPLVKLLDTLKATFESNANYLADSSNFNRQILSINDPYVKNSLDESISELNTNVLIVDFVDHILKNHSKWTGNDDDTIGQFISNFMERAFADTINKTLEDYLKLKFPEAIGPAQLANEIETKVIKPVYDNATAMFSCDPNFSINTAFMSHNLTVPFVGPTIYNAATNFSYAYVALSIRNSSVKDRIFATRMYSGIPFYAYNGVRFMKLDYDKDKNRAYGAGSHLYEDTGRGENGDKSGKRSWRTFLPDPIPYSLYPDMTGNTDEKIQLYEAGIEKGIIGEEYGSYYIYVTDSLDLPQLTIDDCIITNMQGKSEFDELKYNDILNTLKDTLKNMQNRTLSIKKIALKNDGNPVYGSRVVDAVRRDHFLQYPVLQQCVRNELEKQQAVEIAIENLEKLFTDFKSQKDEV